jgi:hypothetical protein
LREDNKFWWLMPLTTLLGVVAAMFIATVRLDRAQCIAAWAGSGLPVSYTLMAQCQVKLPDGHTVPSRTVRYLDPSVTVTTTPVP